ncbi:sensor histidine kinase [Paenibacillus apiarius]|uniref:sensor histidine kinase n=1 Tax=Paenibacillus apiarius TaxID=46240 RepID=UPI00197D697C|nr:HAMP domain-containing sensor histidine kinase [Paenibacillus apiarius]MBN3523671.1 HAMP domain-containing histidine kinase [Paenibacillus apiarius]
MKFWQKICLFSILVFVVIFNLASVFIIERNHGKLLKQEINATLRESLSIRSTVETIVPILKIYHSLDYEKTVLSNTGTDFMARNNDPHLYLQITREPDHHTVYSSSADAGMPHPRRELLDTPLDEIRYMLSDADQRTMLFTVSQIEINQKRYAISYMKDVTPVYAERMEQYQFFRQVDIAACLIYMILMFFISKGLTKPIENMVGTAQVIAQGDFSKRVEISSQDEIGNLATHFNGMVAVVEEKIKALEMNNLEKQRFIHNLTHELKTPLTSIIGYAEFLRVTKYDERVFVDGLDVIGSEARRLESLAAKMMDLIVLRGDEVEMRRENLRAVIGEMEAALALKAEEKQIELVLECEDCWLRMEKDLMKVLIFNLADNAIKASSAQGRVTIKVYNDNKRRIVEVADQGIGMSQAHLAHIFEPFYVADKARTRKSNGAGLGLSICHSIARIHRGTFEVISEEGAGTTIKAVFEDRQEEVEAKANR